MVEVEHAAKPLATVIRNNPNLTVSAGFVTRAPAYSQCNPPSIASV
jgi:hypothetical protein